jgi:hypothetical protein
MTTTAATATKQTSASLTPPSPPCSVQQDPTLNEPKESAVENDAEDPIDAFEKEFELVPNPPETTNPDHDPVPVPDPSLDFLNALMAEEEDRQTKRKPLGYLTKALLEQNRFLIEQLAQQNRFTIDRLVPPPLPPLPPLPCLPLCVVCGAGDQKSGGSKEKKSKSLAPNVHIVIRRGLRILTVMLLVVIAVQLGLIRGQGLEEKNARRTGFFR